MSLKEQARRVAVLKALRDAVDAEYERTRRTVLEGLRSARDELGLRSLRVGVPDDAAPVALITLVEPADAVVVTDETAFTAWVAAHRPTEVETVTRVRPAWRERYLGGLEAGAGDTVADPVTGEVVAGVGVRRAGGPRSFSLRLAPGGREEIARAWRDGRVDLREVLATPAGDGAALPEPRDAA